jgi:hypothetical protein
MSDYSDEYYQILDEQERLEQQLQESERPKPTAQQRRIESRRLTYQRRREEEKIRLEKFAREFAGLE